MRKSKYQVLIIRNDETYKLCSLCNSELQISSFTQTHNTSGYASACKPCTYKQYKKGFKKMSKERQKNIKLKQSASRAKWRNKNKEEIKLYQSIYSQLLYLSDSKIRNRININRKKYLSIAENRLRINKIHREAKYDIKYREQLTPRYLKHALGLKGYNVPESLLNLKKEQLKLYRKLKQL